jgi:hypothetical protein
MKTGLIFLIFVLLVLNHGLSQVAISTDGALPDNSAMLDVKSNSKGFLPPRLTTLQRTALGATATVGLIVYDTDLKKLFFHNGTSWDEGGIGNYWQKNGNNVSLNTLTDFVGIGTTSPTRALEVRGFNWQTARISSSSSGAGLEFVSSAATDWCINSYSNTLFLTSGVSDFTSFTDQYGITTSEIRPTSSGTKTLGTASYRWGNVYAQAGDFTGMVTGVDAKFTGNIAMGTTFATGYKLSVSGKVICTELRVNQVADWPDYVFQKDYQLMPVTQLESFIGEYGHLPNIPPAAEISKSGIEVGEMQRRMMEKIEELSLYVIQLKKEIDQLKGKPEKSTR